jgi:eukaryotic-like serine/threonine-protein kinase
MNSSARVVCSGCLRSVEISGGSEERASSECPHCGSLIETDSSHFDSVSPSDSADAELATSTGALATRISEAVTWAKNWARGSLGSLGRFQLRERLGDGGFGEVYRAYDPRLDRDVAVKILKQPNPGERVMERFFREARAVARLDHPNIVAVHDAGYDGGRCWVAYHLVVGRPLWWYRDHHRMDAVTAARVVRALADALDHAHHMGVLHRDLKPANVLIDDQGKPRLIDFGLARRSDFESDLTREGAIVGTPAYMSPEQALGVSRLVDERSDVYSLGVIFYELLHGRRPDEAGNSPTVKPRRPVGGGSVPPALRRICDRSIAMVPSERHATARSLADELDVWLRTQHKGGRSFPYLAAGICAASLLVAAAAVSWAVMAGRNRADRGGPQAALVMGMGSLAGSATATGQPAEINQAAGARLPGDRVSEGVPSGSFIVNTNTKIYHRPECSHVGSIAAHHRGTVRDAEEAAGKGFQPCGLCRPEGSRTSPAEGEKGKGKPG